MENIENTPKTGSMSYVESLETMSSAKRQASNSKAIDKESAKVAATDKMIPKHRFDCINLCLKETKQELKEKALESEANKSLIKKLRKALLISKIETALVKHGAKDLVAVKALMDFSNLKPEHDGSMPRLEEEVLRIKKSRSYLFESQEEPMYVLVPVKSGDPLNKSIAGYINETEK